MVRIDNLEKIDMDTNFSGRLDVPPGSTGKHSDGSWTEDPQPHPQRHYLEAFYDRENSAFIYTWGKNQ